MDRGAPKRGSTGVGSYLTRKYSTMLITIARKNALAYSMSVIKKMNVIKH
jgi:hypothetical protein